jgi:hypothetical protein
MWTAFVGKDADNHESSGKKIKATMRCYFPHVRMAIIKKVKR